jgi:uncharacterized oxidoreductase
MDLNNNTILITGGATGIGFALARQLAERGNQVIVCGRQESALAKAKAAVPALVTRTCDVTDRESRQELVDWIGAFHPELNMLVNNAGVQYRRLFSERGAFDTLDEEVATNFTAQIHMVGEVLPLLRLQPRAAIINVSSGLAFAPRADTPVYGATKAAIHSFTLSLRHQLKTTGIRVVEMVPPIVDTDLGGHRSVGVTGQYMMSPDDFAAEALAQLAEDKDEVVVGMSVDLRKQGEAMFERLNSY